MMTRTRTTIWNRLFDPELNDLSPELARHILNVGFSQADNLRMDRLSSRARKGTLTPAERIEAEEYRRVGDIVALLQSKARQSLRKAGIAVPIKRPRHE